MPEEILRNFYLFFAQSECSLQHVALTWFAETMRVSRPFDRYFDEGASVVERERSLSNSDRMCGSLIVKRRAKYLDSRVHGDDSTDFGEVEGGGGEEEEAT